MKFRGIAVLAMTCVACSSNGGPAGPNVERVQEVVGTDGGLLEFTDGASLELPSGSLTIDTDISLTQTEEPVAAPPTGFGVSSPTMVLEPHGQAFEEPLSLTLTFEKDPAVNASKYLVMRLADETDTTWEVVENAYPADDGTVTFTIQTFSVISVVQRTEECVSATCASNPEGFAERYEACRANGRDDAYCADRMGCAGFLQFNNTVTEGTSPLCETVCDTDPCVNGTCNLDADGGFECLCFGGFEGETCESEVDLCPGDAEKTAPGACGCGVADTDLDQDGVLDCADGCPQDFNKSAAGACGCGISDVDGDEDGTPDCNDGCPADTGKTAAGACGCGVADTDSDADGTPDCEDGCPADTNKTAAGVCGCGTSDVDSDSDQTPDCNDECPSDSTKQVAGECGCGVAEGTCAPPCPCFDDAYIEFVFGLIEGGCVVKIQDQTGTTTSTQGFYTAESNYIVASVSEYPDSQGYVCDVSCSNGNTANCTNTTQFIEGEATYNACESLISGRCPLQ